MTALKTFLTILRIKIIINSSIAGIAPMDIHFYEAFAEEAETLRHLLGSEYSYQTTDKTIQETGHTDPPARLISIRTQSIIPPEWGGIIDAVLSRSTGYDHLVKFKAQVSTPVLLGYLNEYSTRAVAEHAMMMVMALLRKLPQQIRQFPSFERDGLTGIECEGKKLLVVGVGRIGSEIVKVAKGLGFHVHGVDIVPDKADVKFVSKEEGIHWADVIVCSMNLTTENRAYFNHALLDAAKKGIMFVNIARGELSPLHDLDRLLKEGHLAGLGLDVFEEESTLAVSLRNRKKGIPSTVELIDRLLSHSNVLLTPHNAFNSSEALLRKSEMSVQQIRHFFQKRDFLWKVR
ncbi:MAG: NAD(P)-dependent oxidoreductase [bacterium]